MEDLAGDDELLVEEHEHDDNELDEDELDDSQSPLSPPSPSDREFLALVPPGPPGGWSGPPPRALGVPGVLLGSADRSPGSL
jgi:hypothetical protein